LAAGRLGGVGLDVLPVEPPPADHPLCDARAPWAGRVVVTPHIGWGAVEARRRLPAAATDNPPALTPRPGRHPVECASPSVASPASRGGGTKDGPPPPSGGRGPGRGQAF